MSDTSGTAGSINYGLNLNTSNITTDISLQNGETIDNNVDGTINFVGGIRFSNLTSCATLTTNGSGDVACGSGGGGAAGGYISVTTDEDSNGSSAEFDIFEDGNYPGTLNYTTNASSGITFTPSNGRYTISNTNTYFINLNAIILTTSDSTTDIVIKVNGTNVYLDDVWIDSSSDPNEVSVGLILDLTASDYVEFFIDGDSTQYAQSGTSATIMSVAGGADLAETYATDTLLNPGELVSIDATKSAIVKKSSKRYDPGLVGVVSTRPGLVLADGQTGGNSGLVAVGLAGRVPVRVNTSNGNINPGDWLTSSASPGAAMKATRPGTVIGRALTSFINSDPNAQGQVLVFLDPGVQESLNVGDFDALQIMNASDVEAENPESTQSAAFAPYMILDQQGNVIENAGAFSKLAAGEANFGSLTAINGSFENLEVSNLNVDGIATASAFYTDANSVTTNNGSIINRLFNNTVGNIITKFSFQNADGLELMGIDSNGNATVSGTLTTNVGNYDLAEDYPTNDDSIEAGDVVSIDPNSDEHIQKSTKPYENSIIGIYSEKPGFKLSQKEDTINGSLAIPVALAGRVPVKVSSENGNIKKGDYLTSSSISGVAMKATKPGQVLGKALEDYSEPGIGKVIAFVNVTFADPKNSLTGINLDENGNVIVENVSSSSIDLPDNLFINGKEVNGSLANALIAVSDELNSSTQRIKTIENRLDEISFKDTQYKEQIKKVEDKNKALAKNVEDVNQKVDKTQTEIDSLNSRINDLLSRIPSGANQANNEKVVETTDINTATNSGSFDVTRVLGADEFNNATNSGSLDLINELGETIDSTALATPSATPSIEVTNEIATVSASLEGLKDLQTKVDSLIATIWPSFAQQEFNPLLATAAAQLSLDGITTNTATIVGSLNVLGRTVVNDLGVTGKITSGALSINGLDEDGNSSINTLGSLKLQDKGLGGIDILSGKILIDEKGNIKIQNKVEAKTVETEKLNITSTDTISSKSAELSASAGNGTLPKNTNTITIKTKAVTSNSIINISFNDDYSPALRYWIDEKVEGKYFKLKMDAKVSKNVKFNWWIVN